MMPQKLAKEMMRRCDELGKISEERGRLTRTFASPAMRRANKLVGSWMRKAGLQTHEDTAFNLLGKLPVEKKRAKTFLLGSHLDTVRNAGKYDGPLGVLVAIAAVELLRERGVKLPFNLEVVGFSDEEGVRYHTTYLGSRALVGTLTKADLAHIKEKQIIKARRDKNEFLGYAEVHIEQGPVLEQNDLPVGVVTAIAGQSRLQIEFHGVAGHAGTVPMNLRQDALAGAAEFVSAVEATAASSAGTVATIGKLSVSHGASNVIPGHVMLTLDVRDQNDAHRLKVVKALEQRAKIIAKLRGLKLDWKLIQQAAAVPCDKSLTQIFSGCVSKRGFKTIKLPSGAGHDAVALAEVCPVAMLFVRCKGGISHNPAESVKTADVAVAIGVLADFIQTLAVRHV
jgi:hydantoinase/carbamoylase family amidase